MRGPLVGEVGEVVVLARLEHQHQRRAVVRVLEDRLGVPGHVAGGVAQELAVFGLEVAPDGSLSLGSGALGSVPLGS
mgnify:CR=1 FL=1